MKKKAIIILSVYTFISGVTLAFGLQLLITAFAPKIEEAVGRGISNEADYFRVNIVLYPTTKYKIQKSRINIKYFDWDGTLMYEQNRSMSGERDEWNVSKTVLTHMPKETEITVTDIKVKNGGDIAKGILLLIPSLGAVGIWIAFGIIRIRNKKKDSA